VAAGVLGPGFLGGLPGVHGDEGLVDGLAGPEPLVGGGLVAALVAGAAAAEYLVAGVLRVGQHHPHAGHGPPAVRGRVGGRVGVEPLGDRRDAQLLDGAPPVDGLDGGPAGGVGDEAGLGAALAGLHRDGVGVAFGGVPVRGDADVPPGCVVLGPPLPGLLLELEPVPLRHTLLHPADQDGSGVDAGDVGGLVGGEQRYPVAGQLLLQAQRGEGVAGAALDVLAHHHRETGAGAGGLVQEVGHPAVAGQADVGQHAV
jgi:hypothetical protein